MGGARVAKEAKRKPRPYQDSLLFTQIANFRGLQSRVAGFAAIVLGLLSSGAAVMAADAVVGAVPALALAAAVAAVFFPQQYGLCLVLVFFAFQFSVMLPRATAPASTADTTVMMT